MAKLAKLPDEVINRANLVLETLEENNVEDCLIEECQEKQSNLDTCYGAVNNQYMYLCGVLATAYELKLISKDEYDKLRKQVFDEVFN